MLGEVKWVMQIIKEEMKITFNKYYMPGNVFYALCTFLYKGVTSHISKVKMEIMQLILGKLGFEPKPVWLYLCVKMYYPALIIF